MGANDHSESDHSNAAYKVLPEPSLCFAPLFTMISTESSLWQSLACGKQPVTSGRHVLCTYSKEQC